MDVFAKTIYVSLPEFLTSPTSNLQVTLFVFYRNVIVLDI